MFKKLFTDTLIYTLPTVVNRFIGIFFFIFLARFLGPESFASIELLALTLILINRVVSLEINRGFGREIVDQEQDKVSEYISTTLLFLCIGISISIFIFSLLPYSFLENLLKAESGKGFLFLFLLILVTNSLFLMTLEIFRWCRMSLTYSLLSLGGTIVSSSACLILMYFYDASLGNYILGQVSGNLIFLAIGIFLLSREFQLKFVFRLKYLRSMLSFAYPIFIFLIGFYLLNYLDRWALAYHYGEREVGIYAGIFRISSILSIALLGSRLAFTPLAIRNKDSGDEFSSILHFILFFLISLSLFINVFSDTLIILLLGEEYIGFSHIIPMLLLSKIFLSIYVFSPGLEINKETKKMIFIISIPMIIGGFLIWILTNKYGLTGTAVGSCLTSFIFITLYLFSNQRTGRVKYSTFGILATLLIYLFCSYIFYALDSIIISSCLSMIAILVIWKILFTANEKMLLRKGYEEIKNIF